ncbi:YbeD family protein [Inmirania thermothiophila]|uniref:UPF0250 protein EDC57_0583 n=1 Tax=Inmirania thermothiophila TaxID=1750597 RepID=A0A3N1YAM5_9GAMM|nr:DUF493 domain-containing protein [Inmirania thermothiophila]ROR34682.1 hypothetical protein EDC57_0583 [Inmirania thermothiophila]
MRSDQDSPLQFPCEFPVKVIGAAGGDFLEHVLAICREIVGEIPPEAVSTRTSQEGRYLAVTVRVEARSRLQLDSLYQALHASERVLMLL